jgi:outer membrane protein assembly factor BamB
MAKRTVGRLLCVVALMAQSGMGLAADWPLARGDAVASGVYPDELPAELKLAWKYPVKNGSFTAGAVIAGGVVFVGDLDGTLFALRLADGKELWTYRTGSSISAAAAVRDGRVYVTDVDGRLTCIDAKSGKEIWQYKTPSAAEINSSPNFHKQLVLFGSQDATLYAVDAEKGTEAWTFQIGDQIRCSPTVVEGRTFLAGCDSKLHVVDVESGKGVSDVDIREQTGSTPAVRGDVAYFGTEGGAFHAVHWRDHSIAWTFRDEKQAQGIRSSAAVTADLVIFGGRDKLVRALERATGNEKWKFATRGMVDSSPLVAGSRAYFGSADGRLYAVDVKTGKEVWKYEAGGRFSASPAASDEKLIIANEDGTVYCFGAKQ